MKTIFLKILLIFTAILEIGVGLVVIIKPEVFNEICDEAVKSLSASFAIGAISIGLMSLLCFVFMKSLNISLPLGILGAYNFGICIVQIAYPISGLPVFAPFLFHGLLASTFIYFSLNTFRNKDEK